MGGERGRTDDDPDVFFMYDPEVFIQRSKVICTEHRCVRNMVSLRYLLLFAVALLCCDISFTDLLPAMHCSHLLIIHVYLMFLYNE